MIQDAPLSDILAALDKAQELAVRLAAAEADEWLEAEEAARYLKMNPQVFRRMAAEGKIPRHKPSGYRYYKPELRRWAMEQ
jgi:hypothetical protein